MLSLRALTWTLACASAVACGGGSSGVQLTHNPADAFDVYGQIAAAAAQSPCAAPSAAGPVPTATKRSDADFGADVVFYLAHPEDEILFTPGTMAALVRAHRRVFEVVMTHGEGGRLLKRDASGALSEQPGVSPAQVAQVRDRELAKVMKLLGIEYEFAYPASVGADFPAKDVEGRDRAVHACGETYEKWDRILPGGLAGLLKSLVTSIRTRKPRVIVTHDARDDDDWLDHGHHKALGALVEMAARAAADPRAPGGAPHVVEELVAIAPIQVQADLQFPVGTEMRRRLMLEHESQFEAEKYAEILQRHTERFVIRWRAKGVDAPVLAALMK